MEFLTNNKFSIFLLLGVLSVVIYCDTEMENNGTAGEDIDGMALIEMGRRLNKPMLTFIGMAINNLHRCSEWTEWGRCDVREINYFGTRNRSRKCKPDKGTNDKPERIETDLGLCEGETENKNKTVCPLSYNMTTHGFCIKLNVTPTNNDDADADCKKDGGFLINIDSDERFADVKSVLSGFSVGDINIGGRRKNSNSLWEYDYGSNSEYLKWFSASYPDSIESRKCLALENFKRWNLPCSTKYPFMCEIPLLNTNA